MNERRLPPVTAVAMTSLALIVAGGIYLSSHIPQHVPLAPAIALLVASTLVLVVNYALLRRVPHFAWHRFFSVARWALLAYALTAGMIEYAFVRNHLKGGPLIIVTLSLVIYALQVPTLIGFTVARYDTTDAATPATSPH